MKSTRAVLIGSAPLGSGCRNEIGFVNPVIQESESLVKGT